MLYICLVAGAIVCAFQAVRARRLLAAALWLAGVSALIAILLYMLGAREVAVIELSVGAGLVTVLFVFAINVAGEEAMDARAVLPRPIAWTLVIASSALLGEMILPSIGFGGVRAAESSFASVLWQDRGLDVLVQIVLIFAGVLGVLGLLTEARVPSEKRVAEKAAAQPALAQVPDRSTPEEVHV